MSVFRQNIITPNLTDLIGFGATLNPDGSISAITGPTIGTVNAAPVGSANPGSLRLRRDAGQVSLYMEMDGTGTWQRMNPAGVPTILPVPVAEGGTGATTPGGARTNLSAEAAGTAAAGDAAHLAAFNHANIPSALPVPVNQGGTGQITAPLGLAALGGLPNNVASMWVGTGTPRVVDGYNILATDLIPHDIDTTGGAVNLNLPAAAAWVAANPNIPFVRIGWMAGNPANAATVTPNGAEQINLGGAGVAYALPALHASVDLYPVAGGWVIR